jgi:hypothetical protein
VGGGGLGSLGVGGLGSAAGLGATGVGGLGALGLGAVVPTNNVLANAAIRNIVSAVARYMASWNVKKNMEKE